MIFGGREKYVNVESSKKFKQKTPYGAGVYFTWLPIIV